MSTGRTVKAQRNALQKQETEKANNSEMKLTKNGQIKQTKKRFQREREREFYSKQTMKSSTRKQARNEQEMFFRA